MSFTPLLIQWQAAHGRHGLPWQKTRDAYRIWLSEIMLQQTQVSTVIPYFERFLASFPEIGALAAAPIGQVIEHWAGLGYYARARNLHRCAIAVVEKHGGKFPEDPVHLAELPGIGRSTAAAIAAFAYGRKAAILDGNVKRVLCRQFAIEGFPAQAAVDRKLWTLAEQLLPEDGIESYTQGLMDLGATVCTRSRPRCTVCPVQAGCLARQQGRTAELPTPRPKKTVPERSSCFVLICDGERLLLQRRPPSGLWGGLLVPPEGEPAHVLAQLGMRAENIRQLPPLRHSFTHFKLQIEPVLCLVSRGQHLYEPGFEWWPLQTAAAAGLPAPMQKLVRRVASAQG